MMAPEDGLKHKTRTGAPIGTPYYMSPEQCRGRDVDHRTDLYAFGVLAYLLLTGKFPHDADDYMSILMRQLTEHPDPPSSVVDDLPPGVDDAIGWLIAKDPADRPPNLRTAVGVFEAAAEAAGITVGTDAWDVHTPAPGAATQPPNVGAARISGVPAKPPSNPWARRSTKQIAPPPPRKSRGRLYAAIGGVVVAAAVAAVLVIQPWATSSTITQPPVAPESKPVHVPVKVDPPAKPAPAPMPEAQTVIVTVTGVPEGTEVLVGGMTVGAAPGPVQLPRDAAQQVVMVFKADGFKLESRTILPDKDQSLTIALKKKPVSAPTKKPTKDDIIEVFKK
jgi:serine/threonine-protein kinase